MSEIWLTADLHIGHQNIIYHCRRPFKDKFEHDSTIIKNYNEVVGIDDHVYILGDVCFDGFEVENLKQLKGNKHIILGNHDKKKKLLQCLAIPECRVVEIVDIKMLKTNGLHVWLSHYPHRSWKNSFHGSYHAFGHCHGTMDDYGRSTDVGVDCWNYYPVNLNTFIDKLKDKPYGELLGEFKGIQK